MQDYYYSVPQSSRNISGSLYITHTSLFSHKSLSFGGIGWLFFRPLWVVVVVLLLELEMVLVLVLVLGASFLIDLTRDHN